MGWKVLTVQYLFNGKFYTKETYMNLRSEYLEKIDKKIERKRRVISFLDRFF